MPHKSHTSKPPSWGTLFPGLPSTASTYTPLPQYVESGAVQAPVEKSEGTPAAKPSWSRFGRITTLLICLACLSVLLVLAFLLFAVPQPKVEAEPVLQDLEDYDPRTYLKGPPAMNFTDNLRDDVKYITSWISAGWTNDVMTYANLIYLGHLTQRVPILPVFAPSHLGMEAGYIQFGDVFDVPRLSAATHEPVIEWHDVKDVNSTQWETLGCWSVWLGSNIDLTEPRGSMVTIAAKLDVSYTSIPYSFKLYGPEDPHTNLDKLMTLGFPSGRAEALSQNQPRPSVVSGAILEPDDHLMCLDYLYFTGVDRWWEWEFDWSPQWRFAGVHMRWAPKVEALAEEYLNRHWGSDLNGPVPAFISVHVRRGDFRWACENNDQACLPTISQLGRRIREVQEALVLKRDIRTDRVLITSDETNSTWWQDIAASGWTWVDHVAEQTDAKYGKWFTPLLDAVFQSMGTGFVGTEGSTMSLVAERRVQDWNNGVTTRLRWKGVAPEDL